MLLPAAAAAMLLVGVSVSRRLDLENIAEQSVQWHRTSLPMDVHGQSAESVRRFLSDKVPFAVRLPRLRAPDAQLEGARLSSLAGRRAAYLRYRVRGEPVSVFIVDPKVVRPLESDERRGARRVSWHGVRGYNVAVYTNEGMGYAVTSGMDRHRLIELIGDAR
jgi:anti-sigma factor RsiW